MSWKQGDYPEPSDAEYAAWDKTTRAYFWERLMISCEGNENNAVTEKFAREETRKRLRLERGELEL